MKRGNYFFALVVQMIVLLVLVGCLTIPPRNADACLPYEPKIVELSDVILREIQPGPTNYESIATGDEPITFWSLKTAQTYCLPCLGDIMEGGVSGVTEFQMVLSADQYETYRSLVGLQVICTGTLHLGHTGHHFKPVLINVKDLVRQEPL